MTWWRTLVVVMSVGILTAGHSALFAQRPGPAAPPTAPPAPVPVPPRPPSVRAWLDADQIPDGGTVKVWVVIDNPSPQPMADVRFDALELHGFNRVAGCWRDSTPSCPPGSTRPDAQDSIAGSTQLVRWAEFNRVQSDNGRSALFGSLRWTNAATNATSYATISLPTIQLLSTTRPWSTSSLAIIVGLFGTAITVIANLMIQGRTQKQALFTALLPKNLKNAESYYLPLQATIERMAALSKPAAIEDPSAASSRVDELTFHWLLLSRRMRLINQKAGGFYFKSYLGEQLAADAWDQFKLQEIRQNVAKPSSIDRELVFQVVGQLEPTSNPGDFKTKRTADDGAAFDTDVRTLQKGFAQWRTTTSWEFALICAKVLFEVLSFEINRPHELWYVDSYPREPHTETLNKLTTTLRRLNLDGDADNKKSRDDLVELLRNYVNRSWGNGGIADDPATPR